MKAGWQKMEDRREMREGRGEKVVYRGIG